MEYDLNIREYWRILRKRRFIILFSALLTGVFSFSLALVNKPVPIYTSTSTVKIEKTSTTTGIYLEALSWSGADYLATQGTIITSYPIIEKTAQELGMIPKDLDSNQIRTDSEMIDVVLELKGQVLAEREGESNLIDITAQSHDPKKSQDIANALARVYTREHTSEINKRTLDARTFIEKQLKDVEAKLHAAEENLTRFREEENVISLDSQTTSILNQLTTAEAEYTTVARTAEDMAIMVDRLKKAGTEPLPTNESFFVDQAPPLYTTLNNKLVTLLLEKDTLLLTCTREHPKVIEVESQIHELTRNMMANLNDILTTAKTKAEALKQKIDDYQRQLDSLPGKGLTLARFERDVNFNEKVYGLLEEKLQEAKIMEAAKIEEVIIIKPALEPTAANSSSNVKMKSILGLIVGLIIGLIFAFIYETFDTSIGAVKEVEEFVGVKVLGIIPDIDLKTLRKTLLNTHKEQELTDKFMNRAIGMSTHFTPNSTVSESFRSVRTNVQFSGFEKQMKTIAFTSAIANEGKSNSIVNVAIAMAQAYNRVLLVDADLRKPDIARIFGINGQPGLTEVILGSYEWQDVVQNITDIMLGEMDVDDIMRTPGLDNLHILTGGRMPLNPAELLTSVEFDNFFKAVHDHYDVILIDLPPILAAADTTIIGSRVDGVVLVYRAGSTARGALRRAKEQLDHSRANIVGIILNGLRAEVSLDFGELHYQRYGYGHKKLYTSKKSRLQNTWNWLKNLFSPAWLQKRRLPETSTDDRRRGMVGKLLVVLLATSLLWLGLHLLQ